MTETVHHHTLTPGCPLSCLEHKLPARTFNAFKRHLRWQHSGPPTVGHVADLHRQGQLEVVRGLGVGGIEVIASVLKSAGLGAGSDAARQGPAAHSGT